MYLSCLLAIRSSLSIDEGHVYFVPSFTVAIVATVQILALDGYRCLTSRIKRAALTAIPCLFQGRSSQVLGNIPQPRPTLEIQMQNFAVFGLAAPKYMCNFKHVN